MNRNLFHLEGFGKELVVDRWFLFEIIGLFSCFLVGIYYGMWIFIVYLILHVGHGIWMDFYIFVHDLVFFLFYYL
jgi:hypothetical protein